MRLKTINSIEFHVVVTNYFKKRTTNEVINLLAKKFDKGGKEIASLIAQEIISAYDIRVEMLYKQEGIDPVIAIGFLPKRKHWHKK